MNQLPYLHSSISIMRTLFTLWRNADKTRQDLVITGSLVLLVYITAWLFNLAERLNHFLQSYEFIQLDELPLALFAATIASAWFSTRRMLDLKQEIIRRAEAELQLARSLEENRALGQYARQAQEEERRSLARELHDEIGQYLTAIRLCAMAATKDAGPSGAEHARRISEHAGHLQNCCKNMLQRLRPVVLDHAGLTDSLRQLTSYWSRENPDTQCTLALDDACNNVPDKIKTTAYRILQEAMTNVARHAKAKHVDIQVQQVMHAGMPHLLVEITDDGVGFERTPRQSCFGLLGMRERTEALGGTFSLISGFDAGVQITVQIPLENTD